MMGICWSSGGMPSTNHLMEHDGLDKLLKDFHMKNKNMAAYILAPVFWAVKNFGR